jgi:hypothetical protein
LDVLLRLVHSVMSAVARAEAVTVRREAHVEARTEHLQNRLLDEPIQDRRDTELALASVCKNMSGCPMTMMPRPSINAVLGLAEPSCRQR